MTEDDVQLTPVFVTSGVRTSAGAGPGVRYVPVDEAGRLVAMRHAIHGTEAPRGFDGGAAAVSN